MSRVIELLCLATAALRDVREGFPLDEIAASNQTGLDHLLRELAGYLRGNGINDEGGFECSATQDIPVSEQESLVSQILADLKNDGLSFQQCISLFAAEEANPYVDTARESTDENLTVDARAVVSEGEDGAWVSSWIWVARDDLKSHGMSHSEMLQSTWGYAKHALEKGRLQFALATIRDLRYAQLDWLEDLLTNHADRLDDIERETPSGRPGLITWQDKKANQHHFMPSDALFHLLMAARIGGMATAQTEDVEQFIRQFGNKLDTLLCIHQAV